MAMNKGGGRRQPRMPQIDRPHLFSFVPAHLAVGHSGAESDEFGVAGGGFFGVGGGGHGDRHDDGLGRERFFRRDVGQIGRGDAAAAPEGGGGGPAGGRFVLGLLGGRSARRRLASVGSAAHSSATAESRLVGRRKLIAESGANALCGPPDRLALRQSMGQ